MTITRDHVSDLAEKAPRSGKASPSAATATAAADVEPAAASSAVASRRNSDEGPAVTLATLRSLPENEEVTLYLDVVPGAPPGPKQPKSAPKPPPKTVAKASSEFDKFLKRPCPDLGGLLHTLESKIATPSGGRQSSAKPRAEEEVVATVSQCVIVRKISTCDEGGGAGCANTGKLTNTSTPMPPPSVVLPRNAEEKRSAASSKVDATIDACLLGESWTATTENVLRRLISSMLI